jgi:hypothetical protein
MTAEEVIEGIESLALVTVGFLEQEPFRRKLYALCLKAYDAGLHQAGPKLNGEGLTRRLEGRLSDEQLRTLRITWDAWLYAMTHLR